MSSAMHVVWRLAAATALVCLAFAMVPFLLIGLLIPVVPRVLARWGVVRTYRAGCLLQLVGGLGFALTQGIAWWSLASVVCGIGAAALWNATEALLAREAPPDQRGRVMGLYQTWLGAALALGPFVPGLLGLGVQPVLWAAAAVNAVCCAMALAIPVHATREPAHAQAGTWHAMRTMPMLAAIAFAGGVFEAGLGSVSAAHASATGLGLSAAASVAGAIGTGSFLCQYPAGMAADRFRARTVFGGAALLLLAASAAFAFAPQAPWLLWVSGVVWGGVGGALYTLTMVHVAHALAGRATAGGAAAMITGYTVGGTVGPVASGAALQWSGPPGMALLLGALALATLGASRRVG